MHILSGLNRKAVLATALVSAFGSSILTITFHNGRTIAAPAYSVKEVIDGDSFYLNNGMEIRLANIDSPEINLCGGKEAKAELLKLVKGRPIYLYIITEDKFHRFISMVYTDRKFVNQEMLKEGYSTSPSGTAGFNDILGVAIREAREKKKGIHGLPCTQLTNKVNPKCNIKGNNNDGNKFYYTPDCGYYGQAIVQLYRGDQWFCSEREARDAGYIKVPRCR